MPATPLPALAAAVRGVEPWQRYGRVTGVRGHLVEVSGLVHAASIGARLGVRSVDGRLVELEATALSGDVTRCLPFGSVDGIRSEERRVGKGGVRACRHRGAWYP